MTPFCIDIILAWFVAALLRVTRARAVYPYADVFATWKATAAAKNAIGDIQYAFGDNTIILTIPGAYAPDQVKSLALYLGARFTNAELKTMVADAIAAYELRTGVPLDVKGYFDMLGLPLRTFIYAYANADTELSTALDGLIALPVGSAGKTMGDAFDAIRDITYP